MVKMVKESTMDKRVNEVRGKLQKAELDLQQSKADAATAVAAATATATLAAEKKLSGNFNSHIGIKNTYIDAQNGAVQGIFNALIGKTNAEIDALLKDVSSQNQILINQTEENKANTNDFKFVKSEYQNVEIEKLYHQNEYLWYIFYALILVLGIVMWYFNTLHIVSQVIIFHILLIYPFVMYYFELILYVIYLYLKSFFESTPFKNVYLGNY